MIIKGQIYDFSFQQTIKTYYYFYFSVDIGIFAEKIRYV